MPLSQGDLASGSCHVIHRSHRRHGNHRCERHLQFRGFSFDHCRQKGHYPQAQQIPMVISMDINDITQDFI